MRRTRAKQLRRLAARMATTGPGYVDAEVQVQPYKGAKRGSAEWFKHVFWMMRGAPVREVRRIHQPWSEEWWYRALKTAWKRDHGLPEGWEQLI